MAFVSFQLRQTGSDEGSYNRYDSALHGARTDNDSSLRLSSFTSEVALGSTSFFEAIPVAYGVVDLRWGATLVPVADLSNTPGVVQATEVLIVYSPQGAPQTVLGGDVLVSTASASEYVHSSTALQGKWAYYSLFIRYQSSAGDDFYALTASLEVLVPYPYGSTLDLWNRIPAYYRELDLGIGTEVVDGSDDDLYNLVTLPPGKVVGPLFRFLSIVGFDMDLMRTMCDHIMVARDPYLAESDSLDELAKQVGLPIRSVDLGGERLRTILNNYVSLTRGKGTKASLERLGSAISGSEVVLDTATNTVKVYAQRINYARDPIAAGSPALADVYYRTGHSVEALRVEASQGTYDVTTWGTTDPATASGPYQPGQYWTVTGASTLTTLSGNELNGIKVINGDHIVVAATDDSNDPTFGVRGQFEANTAETIDPYDSYATTASGNVLSYHDNATGTSLGATHLVIRMNDYPVPVRSGDQVFVSVHSGSATNLVLARLVAADGTFINDSVTTVNTGATNSIGIVALDGVAGVNSTTFTTAYVELVVDLETADTYDFSSILVERNRAGTYFDGTFLFGGSALGGAGRELDFKWSGNVQQSESIYTEQRLKVSGVLDSYYLSYFPAGQTWTISHNQIPS